MKIPQSTAQSWVKRFEDEQHDVFSRQTGSGRPVGRPALLGDEHKAFLTSLLDDKPGLGLDEMMESLISQFMGLDVSKSALYNFITEKCRITLKRAHLGR